MKNTYNQILALVDTMGWWKWFKNMIQSSKLDIYILINVKVVIMDRYQIDSVGSKYLVKNINQKYKLELKQSVQMYKKLLIRLSLQCLKSMHLFMHL